MVLTDVQVGREDTGSRKLIGKGQLHRGLGCGHHWASRKRSTAELNILKFYGGAWTLFIVETRPWEWTNNRRVSVRI
jgi:hypothetical protein